MRFIVTLVLLAALCASGPSAFAQTAVGGVWEKTGPGGGGATFIPTFSWQTPDRYAVRCDMTGSYFTTDGGATYRQVNFAGGTYAFAYDPRDSDLLYAGNYALHRSRDGGKSWEQLFPRARDIVDSGFSGDHADYHIDTRPGPLQLAPDARITAIRPDPAYRNRLYFSAGASLFYSADRGATWKKKKAGGAIDCLYTDAAGARQTLYLFSSDSVFVFDKTTERMTGRALPKDMRPAFSFAGGVEKSSGRPVFYALHHTATDARATDFHATQIWISRDGGKTWEVCAAPVFAPANGAAKPSLTMIRCAEGDAGKAYVVCNRFEEKSVSSSPVYWYGALKTDDAGTNWHWVWKGGGGSGRYGVPDAQDAENLTDAWVHRAFGAEFIQLFDVGVFPANGDVAVVTDWYRTMKTTDGGRSWTEVYSRKNEAGAFVSRGLDVTTSYGVHFDPADKDHIAVSYTDIGFHHSHDGGKSWERSVEGVPVAWTNTCYDVVFDPAVKGKLWSAWSGMHDIPRLKMVRNPDWREAARGGICVSEDGGRTWRPTIAGMDDHSPVTCLLLDPSSPAGNRTLYAVVFGKGVFKSTDDGKTWTEKNEGLGDLRGTVKNDRDDHCAFRIARAANGDLYLVVCPCPAGQPGSFEIRSGAVYKSVDGAASWQKLSLSGPAGLFPSGVSTDPANPARVYVACWSTVSLGDFLGRAARAAGADKPVPMPGGIFQSEDGGATWRSIFDSTQYVYDVTVDSLHEGRLYAITFNRAAYRSDDRGRTWKKITGYDFHWGHRAIVDRNDPEKIYLTTFGSGVWHGVPLVAGPLQTPPPNVRM